MQRSSGSRIFIAATMGLGLLTLIIASGRDNHPSYALPIYSRRYGVPCETCHTVPPQLNKTGLSFEANQFNWPGGHPQAYHTGISAIPISGLGTYSSVLSEANGFQGPVFNSQELFVSSGFKVAPGRLGGYFVDYFAATAGAGSHPGNLGSTFVSLPVAGRNGNVVLTLGQFTPISYQWDPNNQLTNALPATFNDPLDNLSLDATSPGVRLEYFNNRGKLSANGDYVDVGIPFDGQLALNSTSHLDGPHGAYAHAFHRNGFTTLGLIGYLHDKNHLVGILGTQQVAAKIRLYGAAATAQDDNGTIRHLSLEADYTPTSKLALAGRYEMIDGQTHDHFPVLMITYYPLKQNYLRLTAETSQQAGNRSTTFLLQTIF